MTGIFHAAIGIACLQGKDNACAVTNLKPAVDASPDTQKDFSLVYPLAWLTWDRRPRILRTAFGMRRGPLRWLLRSPGADRKVCAIAIHQVPCGDDGWAELMAAAKANGPQVAIKPAPSPADQVHAMVTTKKPEEMNFRRVAVCVYEWLARGSGPVWNAIKGKAVQMNGTIIGTTPTEF